MHKINNYKFCILIILIGLIILTYKISNNNTTRVFTDIKENDCLNFSGIEFNNIHWCNEHKGICFTIKNNTNFSYKVRFFINLYDAEGKQISQLIDGYPEFRGHSEKYHDTSIYHNKAFISAKSFKIVDIDTKPL